MKRLPLLLLTISLSLLPPCVAEDEQLQVVVLTGVLGDFTEQVGGRRVKVLPVAPPGANPHFFEPSPGEIRTMSQSDLVLASGLGLEPYLDRLANALEGETKLVVVGESIKNPIEGESCSAHAHAHNRDHSHGEVDPHWWHSVENARVAVAAIRDALIATDPANEAIYLANARAYDQKLAELEKWMRLEVAKLPRQQRVLVTSHAALAYFARDHHFRVLPVQGLSTAEQPSARQLQEIIDLLRREKVNAVFVENAENPASLEDISKESGVRIGGTLYADDLGETEAATYEEMMRHNVSTIVSNLR